MARRQSSVTNRIVLVLSAVIALPLLAGLLVLVLVNPNDYKPDVINALQNATGRKVTIGGRISIGFGLSPDITLGDIHISNPPGFSRDDMAVIGTLSTEVSLPSLIFGKIHIVKLDLTDADVLVETNPLGQTNTKFGPPDTTATGAPVPAAQSASSSAPQPMSNPLDKLRLDEVGIYGGKFSTRDDQRRVRHELIVNRSILRMTGSDQALSMAGDIAYDKAPLVFTLETGALGRLFGQDIGPHDWPVHAHAQSGNSQLSFNGTISDPLGGHGYQVMVDGAVEDLSELSPLLGSKLPPIHDLRVSFNVRDRGGVPDFYAVLLRSGSSDLSAYAPTLSLDHLVLSAPAMDQPMHGEVAGRFNNQPLQAMLDIGAPKALINAVLQGSSKSAAADQSLPMNIDAQIAGAHLTIKGQVKNPAALSGLDVAVNLDIPDLTVFSALAGQRLPALSNLHFGTELTDVKAGLSKGVSLHKIEMNGSLGEVGGDLDILLKPRLALVGKIDGKRFDLDALQVAADRVNVSSVPPSSVVRVGPQPRYVLPEKAIDFSSLSGFDVDLALAMAEIRAGEVFYRDISGHVTLANGNLQIKPFSATLPGGKLSLSLALDSQALPPTVALKLFAPGIALKPLLTAFRQPNDVTGTLEVGADLTAAGRSAHVMAASLNGQFGIAMADGELDNHILGGVLSQVLAAARLPADLVVGTSGGNRTRLQCVALRADFTRGVAAISDMVLQSSTAQVTGSGSANMGDEGLSLRLRPALRTPAGPSVVVPVRVTGVMAQPLISLDPNAVVAGLSAANIQSSVTSGLNNLVRRPVTTLGAVMSDNDPCPPGLAAARAVQPTMN